MIIGVLKEIKEEENRVAMTPDGVEVLAAHGHRIRVERGAGAASGFEDQAYMSAGAEIAEDPQRIMEQAEMILRVREPQPSEYKLLSEGQIWFSFLHLAASAELAEALIKAGSVNIAYETVQEADGTLPILTAMSEVAGPMAIQQGAKYLEMIHGGHGVLMGGVPGVDPGSVVIIGGGVVGVSAARIACGLGAKVSLLEVDLERLRYLSDVMPANCFLLKSSPPVIRDLITRADVVIGSVLVPGSRAPVLVTRDMLRTMKKGAVLVDVAIDQGGCFETSKETTHTDPTFVVDGVVHYAVSNMPGAVPKTSSKALSHASLPFILELAEKGWRRAMRDNGAIRSGANVVRGRVTYEGVSRALGLEHQAVEDIL